MTGITSRRLTAFAITSLLSIGCLVVCGMVSAQADDKPAADKAPATMKLADGSLEVPVPKSWTKKAPRFRIIQYEFEIKGKKSDTPARVTVMGAGGSVDANIDRWKGQFAKVAKVERKESKTAGCTVYLVDISGTYRDQSGGPFSGAPAKLQPGYRMLGAIIVTQGKGQYFIKAVGPAATLAAQRDILEKSLANLKFKAK